MRLVTGDGPCTRTSSAPLHACNKKRKGPSAHQQSALEQGKKIFNRDGWKRSYLEPPCNLHLIFMLRAKKGVNARPNLFSLEP